MLLGNSSTYTDMKSSFYNPLDEILSRLLDVLSHFSSSLDFKFHAFPNHTMGPIVCNFVWKSRIETISEVNGKICYLHLKLVNNVLCLQHQWMVFFYIAGPYNMVDIRTLHMDQMIWCTSTFLEPFKRRPCIIKRLQR